MHPNYRFLLQEIENAGHIDNRFINLSLVNYDSLTDSKRGCFSLVFKAHDKLLDKTVALKFYDIHPQRMHDSYRRHSFRREHEILQSLLGKARCLQLCSPYSTYNLRINQNSQSFELPCDFFAVEWLDEDIDDFFLSEKHIAIEKLKVFREIVLSVNTLHASKIFHRDLKADNLRFKKYDGQRDTVIAIDLGTAARLDSNHLSSNYSKPVGAGAYAAIESFCGFTHSRKLAPYTDKYALGCLLFELFNPDYYAVQFNNRNPNYGLLISSIASQLDHSDSESAIKVYESHISRLAKSIVQLKFDGTECTLPIPLRSMLDDVLCGLTNPNYKCRPTLEFVIKRTESAIKVLSNETLYQRKLLIAREKRENRKNKVTIAQQRLNKFKSLEKK